MTQRKPLRPLGTDVGVYAWPNETGVCEPLHHIVVSCLWHWSDKTWLVTIGPSAMLTTGKDVQTLLAEARAALTIIEANTNG